MKLKFPENLVVGFQERNDSMAGKLGFIVYKEKNKLKKEKSFNGWIDKNIDLLELKNIPRDGFLISKSIRRDGYYFSSGRSMMRVYDPEGFDFEITVDNLEYILQNCNTNKGELEGKFCYMWSGKELVLVPENSDIYQASLELKADVNSKVEVKDLKVGAIYKDKKTDKTFTYLGKFDFYKEFTKAKSKEYFNNSQHNINSYYQDFIIKPMEKKPKNQHLFFDNDLKEYVTNITSKLAYLISEEDEKYQTKITKYFDKINSRKREKIVFKEMDKQKFEKIIRNYKSKNNHLYWFRKKLYVHLAGNYYADLKIEESDYYYKNNDVYKIDVEDIVYYDKDVVGLFSIGYRNKLKTEGSYFDYYNKTIKKDVAEKAFNDMKEYVPEILKYFETDELDINKIKETNLFKEFNKYNYCFDFDWLTYVVLNKLDFCFFNDKEKKIPSKNDEIIKYRIDFEDSFEKSLEKIMSLDLIEPVEIFENK